METEFRAFDLKRMFIGDKPPLFLAEVAVRTIIMYVVALAFLRLIGKRGISQMTPFEYVVIVALGSAVGDPMFYPQIPLVYGMIVIAVVIAMEQLVLFLSNKTDIIRKIVESNSTLIVEKGKVKEKRLNQERLDKDDLYMQLRENNIEFLSEVRKAYLEPDGKISVFKYKKPVIKKNPIYPESTS